MATSSLNSDHPFLAPAFMAPRSLQQQQQQQPPLGHRAPMLPPININPKLPSLEGLLKQMQVGGASRASPEQDEEPHHLSPVPRETSPMPSLRSMISPSMSKNVFASPLAVPVQPRATPLIPLSYPSQAYQCQSAPSAYPPRKRSWADASPVRAAAFQVTKERGVGSPASSTTSSSGPHRSRASKYCKVEGCERVSQRNNLCHSHGGKRLCKEEGCSSKDRGNGYCIKHGGGKICSMAGCEKKARRKGLCTQHFRVAEEGAASSSPYVASRVVYGSF
jgi:hypothetical protein